MPPVLGQDTTAAQVIDGRWQQTAAQEPKSQWWLIWWHEDQTIWHREIRVQG